MKYRTLGECKLRLRGPGGRLRRVGKDSLVDDLVFEGLEKRKDLVPVTELEEKPAPKAKATKAEAAKFTPHPTEESD